MKTTSMSKGSTPENYVRELRLRSPVSSQVYLSILNGFPLRRRAGLNLLRDAWGRVYTIFVMPSSQAACSPGTARVSILSRASRTWPPISGTKISTRRWFTSPLPRICFSKPASDFARGAPDSCSL